MKYICEICGCMLDNPVSMAEHEQQCREKNNSLIYCIDELNALLGLADKTPFMIVAEIPYAPHQTTKDKGAETAKTELKYFPIIAAELDGKKNRCILKVKNEEKQDTPESKTKSAGKQP